MNKIPTFDDALKLSLDFQISLHPQYLYFWDMISSQELSELLEPNKVSEKSIEYSIETKKILEKLGTPHKIDNEIIILEELEVKIFFNLLFRIKPTISDLSVPKIFIKIIRNSN